MKEQRLLFHFCVFCEFKNSVLRLRTPTEPLVSGWSPTIVQFLNVHETLLIRSSRSQELKAPYFLFTSHEDEIHKECVLFISLRRSTGQQERLRCLIKGASRLGRARGAGPFPMELLQWPTLEACRGLVRGKCLIGIMQSSQATIYPTIVFTPLNHSSDAVSSAEAEEDNMHLVVGFP